MEDGLDEFDEDYWDLLNIIDLLKRFSNVKICVSSRPRQEFAESFNGQAGLKLEDLTRGSISKYVKRLLIDDERVKRLMARDSLIDNERVRWLVGREPSNPEVLVETILRRARGVFLWVKLVVKDLRQGLVNKDDWTMLMQRLQDCPQEVEKIFEQKWARYQGDLKRYKEKAENYFRLVLYEEMSLLEFSICVNEELQKVLEESTPRMEKSEVASICEKTSDYITIYCSGLLEIVDHQSTSSEAHEDIFEWTKIEDSPAIGDTSHTVNVRFIHRTARDFVSENLGFLTAQRETLLDLELDIIQAYTQSQFVILVLDPKAAEKLQPLIDEVQEILDRIRPVPEDEEEFARIEKVVCNCLVFFEKACGRIVEIDKRIGFRLFHHINTIACDVVGAAVIQGFGEYIEPLLKDRANPAYLTYLLGCATSRDLRSEDLNLIYTLLNDFKVSPMGDPASLIFSYDGWYLLCEVSSFHRNFVGLLYSEAVTSLRLPVLPSTLYSRGPNLGRFLS
ncbi:MAG: hypothetical protein Q9223_000869 [Gallowayella weberi]